MVVVVSVLFILFLIVCLFLAWFAQKTFSTVQRDVTSAEWAKAIRRSMMQDEAKKKGGGVAYGTRL